MRLCLSSALPAVLLLSICALVIGVHRVSLSDLPEISAWARQQLGLVILSPSSELVVCTESETLSADRMQWTNIISNDFLMSSCVNVFRVSSFQAQSGPPDNYTIGCLATVSLNGGPQFDFNNPQPISAFNCPSTGCVTDSRVSAFLYQLQQINDAKQLLPNTKLIADCIDDQADSSKAFFVAMDLLNRGARAVFGTYYSRVSLNAALVLKSSNVPLISWGATSPDLSNKKLYSNFGRVCQSDAGQAQAMAYLAAKRFNWQSVALIYTADAYGQGGAGVFAQTYLGYNMSIISDQSIIANASPNDVELALQRIKSIGVQTIIYFGHTEEFDSIIVRGTQADLNLFNNHTAWIVSNPEVRGSGPQWLKAAGLGLLNGVTGFAADEGRSTKVWQDWATAYMNRNTTGMHPLITAKPTSFAGFGGYDAFAADVANVAANALKSSFDVGNYNPTPLDWYNAIHSLSIQGITGNISFDSNFERVGLKYVLMNYKSNAWATIGTYVDGALTIDGVLTFADGTSNPPTSFPLPPPPPPPATSVIAESTSKVLLAVTIVVLSITGMFAICLVMGREVKVFQNASVIMLALLIVGGVLVCASVLVALQTQSQSTCTASQFLFNFGFTLTIGSILLKTHRVHVIFNSFNLKVNVLTDDVLLMVIGGMLLFDSVILVLRTTIAPYQLNESLVCTFADGYQSTAALALSLILIITKALMLLYTAYLTYRVRDLPSRFNESSYLSICVYNTILLCLIWLVVRYAIQTDDHPDTINVFECVLKLVGTALILTLIFLPKCITALSPIIGRTMHRSSSHNKAPGHVSILALSAEGFGPTKKILTKNEMTETKRTKLDLQMLIDSTIASQTELLERSYAHSCSLHASMVEKKALIQRTIDSLNQLENERRFFKECVHKNYTDEQIVTIFESRLKDITIPQPDILMPVHVTNLASIGKTPAISMSPRISGTIPPRSDSNGMRVGSPPFPPRSMIPKPFPKTGGFYSPPTSLKQLNEGSLHAPASAVTFEESANAVIFHDAHLNQGEATLPPRPWTTEHSTHSTSSTPAYAPSTPVAPYVSITSSPRRNRIRIHLNEMGAETSVFRPAFHNEEASASPAAKEPAAAPLNYPANNENGGIV